MAPTHAIVNEVGTAVVVGLGDELLPRLGAEFPYAKGYRLKPISEVNSRGDDVSAVTVARVHRQTSMLETFAANHGVDANGWTKAAPVVPLGTRVIALGDDNFAASHQDWEAQPKLEAALEKGAGQIRDENRLDVVVKLAELRMNDKGRLVFPAENGKGNRSVAIERRGFVALLSKATRVLPSSMALFDILTHAERAALFNQQIVKASPEQSVKLRLRGTPGNRALFAVVSETYGVYDGDEIATDLAAAVEGLGLRGEVTYFPETTMLRVAGTWHAEKIVDLGAGDMFEMGIWLKSGDAGNSGCHGGVIIKRNRCRNFIILSDDRVETMFFRHSANFAANVRDGVQALADQGQELLGAFAQDFGLLRAMPVADFFELAEGKTLTESAYSAILDELEPADRKLLDLEMMLRGFELEPGETLADLVNGITRQHELLPAHQIQEVERVAGKVFDNLVSLALSK